MTAASIAKDLRAAIRSGTYKPGDRLPSEAALMSNYGVARMTARHGLSMLKDEGLTVTRHGSGVFVRSFEPIVRTGATGQADEGTVTAEIDETGAGLVVRTLAVTAEAEPSEKIRTALGLAEGDKVTVRERLHLRERKPVLFATSYLPASIAAGTPIADQEVGAGGTHARLAEAGHAPVRFREDVVGRMPTIEEIEELRIEPGTPVLAVTRTAFTKDGSAIEVSHVVLDAGEFMLRYDIS
ncbi:GntR family transcriptional regulator [Promicromonospora kroppenstedtii]|uniref:GntR family transcriptional regulator n=1 Tax=Promicromonospora kroppenstedtii TaxID=440482 RepID=A0ABW7XRJ1_9MICO|nr:GntR family transcriptional regulator [Promicromonospora kroppenstedtii]